MIEKTKISTMSYKGKLIGHGSREENTLESCAKDFRLRANTFIVKILHCVCALSCPTLCNPRGCSLPGFSPWNFSGKNTGVGYHFLLRVGGGGVLPNAEI